MTNSADLASCESADIQRRILELIEGASSIAISGHTSPDGDAIFRKSTDAIRYPTHY